MHAFCLVKVYKVLHFKNQFQEFEGIENEWPLFYLFMIIDGIFKSQPEQVEEYENLLKPRIKKDTNGGEFNFVKGSIMRLGL